MKIKKIHVGVWFGLFSFLAMWLVLLSKTFSFDTLGNLRTAVAGYGDIPFHLTEVSKFAFGSWNLQEPIFYGLNIQYPFAINLVSGLLQRLTGAISFSFQAPIIVCAVCSVFLLFFIFRRLTGKDGFSLLAVVLFFLGGGIGWWNYARDILFGNLTLSDFWTKLFSGGVSVINSFDAVSPDKNISFGAPLSLVYLHQRTSIAGLFGLSLFIFIFLSNEKVSTWWKTLLCILILGALPIFHAHSFVAIFTLLSGYCVAYFFFNREKFWKTFFILFAGSLIALPQFLFLLSSRSVGTAQTAFTHFRLGWMVYDILSLANLHFLWINFGLILPVFIVSFVLFLFAIWKSRKTGISPRHIDVFAFSLASAVLFLAVETIQFQPWDYDDNKLLVYFFLFSLPLLFWLYDFLRSLSKKTAATFLIVFSCVTLFSGVLDILPRLTIPYSQLPVIFSPDAFKLRDYILTHIPEHDLILTGTTHLNPVASLAGRQVVVGYPGWLWSRGIAYTDRETAIRNFYTNPSQNQQILQEFPVKYILLDNQTRSDFHATSDYFNMNYDKVFESGEYSLYAIKQSSPENGTSTSNIQSTP